MGLRTSLASMQGQGIVFSLEQGDDAPPGEQASSRQDTSHTSCLLLFVLTVNHDLATSRLVGDDGSILARDLQTCMYSSQSVIWTG